MLRIPRKCHELTAIGIEILELNKLNPGDDSIYNSIARFYPHMPTYSQPLINSRRLFQNNDVYILITIRDTDYKDEFIGTMFYDPNDRYCLLYEDKVYNVYRPQYLLTLAFTGHAYRIERRSKCRNPRILKLINDTMNQIL